MFSQRAVERVEIILKKINFIAYDYEGVDLYIVEDVIEQRLPVIKQSVQKILQDSP